MSPTSPTTGFRLRRSFIILFMEAETTQPHILQSLPLPSIHSGCDHTSGHHHNHHVHIQPVKHHGRGCTQMNCVSFSLILCKITIPCLKKGQSAKHCCSISHPTETTSILNHSDQYNFHRFVSLLRLQAAPMQSAAGEGPRSEPPSKLNNSRQL